MESAIRAANSNLAPEFALNEEQLEHLAEIVSLLENSHKQKLPLAPNAKDTVEHMIHNWPLDKLLPVLDMIRQLSPGNKKLAYLGLVIVEQFIPILLNVQIFCPDY